MGLSSSQARLLNLTSRMHQIEYKAAKLEAEKLQMANESSRVYEEYLEALEKTKIQYKVLTTDGSITYQDINSYEDFLNAGYAIMFKNVIYAGEQHLLMFDGQPCKNITNVEITTLNENDPEYANMNLMAGDGISIFDIDGVGKFCTITDLNNVSNGNLKCYKLTGGVYVDNGNHTFSSDSKWYEQLCADALGTDYDNPPTNVIEVLTNLINSGDVTIVEKRNNVFASNNETSVATNTNLQEVADESALKKAEAKYEADMYKIDRKDRKYDADLAALDTERNAIKEEMETLKTVAKENVERTFKLFS